MKSDANSTSPFLRLTAFARSDDAGSVVPVVDLERVIHSAGDALIGTRVAERLAVKDVGARSDLNASDARVKLDSRADKDQQQRLRGRRSRERMCTKNSMRPASFGARMTVGDQLRLLRSRATGFMESDVAERLSDSVHSQRPECTRRLCLVLQMRWCLHLPLRTSPGISRHTSREECSCVAAGSRRGALSHRPRSHPS